MTFLALLAISCAKEKEQSDKENNQHKVLKTDKAEISEAMVTSRKTVENFYNWYLSDVYIPYLDQDKQNLYQPEIKQKGNSAYIVDTTRYFNLLRAQPFFSENFIAGERQLIATCNTALKSEKLTEEAEVVNGVELCTFLSYDRWVGGQGEEIRNFGIEEVKELGNKAEVKVSTLTPENSMVVQLLIKLSKEDRKWQIDNITVL